MDSTFGTQYAYFDNKIDRKDKPDNEKYVMLEPKGRKLFWNFRFNYPGTYNLRIQLYLPDNVKAMGKKTIEAGFWGSGERKYGNRFNTKNIYNNDSSHRYIWFNMGTYYVSSVGTKCFYIEKMRQGKPFGVSKICFEYCQNGNEDLVVNDIDDVDEDVINKMTLHEKLLSDLRKYYENHHMHKSEFEEKKTDTEKTESINGIDTDTLEKETDTDTLEKETDNDTLEKDIELDSDGESCLTNYISNNVNIYGTKKSDSSDTKPPSNFILRNLLPRGINTMIDEIVPTTSDEIESMYVAQPSFLYCKFGDIIDINKIGGVYREMTVTKHVEYTYYTFNIPGGHIGLVLDGKNGYFNMEVLDSSSGKSCVTDKHPVAKDNKLSNSSTICYPYQLKQGIKYKLFIRARHIDVNDKPNTVYSCYFGIASKKQWIYIGTIDRPGKHYIKEVGSSIENREGINGHLYTRMLKVENTWVYDDNETGHFINNIRYIANDTSNSAIHPNLNKGNIEIQIGGRSHDSNKISEMDYIINIPSKLKAPVVPWSSTSKFY